MAGFFRSLVFVFFCQLTISIACYIYMPFDVSFSNPLPLAQYSIIEKQFQYFVLRKNEKKWSKNMLPITEDVSFAFWESV